MNASTHNSARFKLELWISFLGAPIVWLIQFQTNYALVPWSCTHGKAYILHITSAAFLAVAGGLIVLSSRQYRESTRGDWSSAPEGLMTSARFMLLIGILNSTLFTLLILAQAIPSFLISPCIQ
jgi:hypothetical protein